ncbi:hypothetical protein V5030_02235 [Moellerella wisconsensis]|uniref:hypothetical protein n=1 Tax=Moellerella wisconsensis TaxID=158849 RepID=UPI003075FC4A
MQPKEKNKTNNRKVTLKLNSEPLYKQLPFHLAIIIPVILFLIFEFPVMKMDFEYSILAFEHFITSSKLAFLFLSLCIPFVAIVMYMHRTVQTHEQIALTQTQINNVNKQLELIQDKNNADLYFSHNKYINDKIISLPKYKSIFLNSNGEKEVIGSGIMSASHIYDQVYTKSNPKGEFNTELNLAFSRKIRNLFDHLNRYILKAKYANDFLIFNYNGSDGNNLKEINVEERNNILIMTLNEIYAVIISLKRMLAINEFPYYRLYVVSSNNKKIAYPYSNESDLIDDINGIRIVCINLLNSLNFPDLETGILQAGPHLGDPITLFLQNSDESYKCIFSSILTSEIAPISSKVCKELPNNSIQTDI